MLYIPASNNVTGKIFFSVLTKLSYFDKNLNGRSLTQKTLLELVSDL